MRIELRERIFRQKPTELSSLAVLLGLIPLAGEKKTIEKQGLENQKQIPGMSGKQKAIEIPIGELNEKDLDTLIAHMSQFDQQSARNETAAQQPSSDPDGLKETDLDTMLAAVLTRNSVSVSSQGSTGVNWAGLEAALDTLEHTSENTHGRVWAAFTSCVAESWPQIGELSPCDLARFGQLLVTASVISGARPRETGWSSVV